jgi:uncharacterized NAD(P)/FAD-binding protein YdhS
MTGPGLPVVAIIGGGLSGAATALHLAGRIRPGQARIVVIEPRPELGQGLAYGTSDPAHRINVPARKMTLKTAEPLDFQHWLEAQPDASGPAGDLFPPRALFGRYAADRLAPVLADGRVEHHRATVRGVTTGPGNRLVLTPSSGGRIVADWLVLATGHPPARVIPQVAPLVATPALVADPFAPGALAEIDPAARVLVIGSGLTAADVVATLARRGHAGPIHLLSRHGRRSMPHGPAHPESPAEFVADPPATALGLLRRIRAALAVDVARGLTWQALFDRLRAQAPAIWTALPPAERARLLRHLRPLWDVHRFRIAPETAATLDGLAATGRLNWHTGRIRRVVPGPDGVAVILRLPGGEDETGLPVDRVVLATGPAQELAIAGNPALAALYRLGRIAPDPLGLGLWSAPDGHARRPDGSADPAIRIAGPIARGAVGELMGVPEVTAWAERLTEAIAADIAAGAATDPGLRAALP